VSTETVVAFDVDKTLTTKDCVLPFMSLVAGRLFLVSVMLRSPLQVASLLRHRDRDGLKRLFVRSVFKGRDASEIDELGEQFASVVLKKWMRADVAQRLRWHQKNGHIVLLVSASLDAYLVPLAKTIGAEAVLCTTLEANENGVLTGNLVGNNCRAQHKVDRLQRWAQDRGTAGDNWLSVAYGDSRGDLEMLSYARDGHNVSRQILEPAC
jgi:phosphatidylglycerophosphatase C